MNDYDDLLNKALKQVQKQSKDYYSNYYTWDENKALTISDIIKHIKTLLKRDKKKYSEIILDQLDEQDIQNYLRSKKLLKIKGK